MPSGRNILLLLAFGLLASCTDVNYPNSGGSYPVYGDPYYRGGGYYDDRYYERRERERNRDERERLDRERERLERDRDRLEDQRREEERRRREAEKRRQQQKKPETCPPGFRPGGRCSSKERKHGCKDIRTPGGLACKSM